MVNPYGFRAGCGDFFMADAHATLAKAVKRFYFDRYNVMPWEDEARDGFSQFCVTRKDGRRMTNSDLDELRAFTNGVIAVVFPRN